MIDQHFLDSGQVVLKNQPIVARQVSHQLALKDALEKHDIKKIFTFHHNVASAKSFSSDGAEGISFHLPNFHVNHVNGTMTTAHREKVMEEFKHAETGLLSNARCLTEGIDVPAVDMVAFMSPKKSKVDIVQAIGRAMRTSPKKEKGYIFIPLYLEQAKNESIESALERSNFQEIWAVLQAIQEQDEVFDQIIQQLNASTKLKRKGFNDARLSEKLEIIGPTISVKKLQKFITTLLVARLCKSWDTMFQMLLMFKKKHGHTNVPLKAKKPWDELGIWVDNVRALKRNKNLKTDRVQILNEIGFRWFVDGQTLENTDGLLNETQFGKAFGSSRIGNYRKKGLIEPVGYAMSGSGIGAYYHPRQIIELKTKFGITLDKTNGLLKEKQFVKEFGSSGIGNWLKKGLIKPIGYAMSKTKVSRYYHPRQIKELKAKLGITLENTNGLLNETQFVELSQFTMVGSYRKKGLIKPVGYALASGGINPYYHPRQIKELKAKIGITLDNTNGLLNENQFGKAFGSSRIGNYRKKGLVEPVGYAMSGSGINPYYHPRQIKELKAKLGITLDNTNGLLSESQFVELSKFWMIKSYRKKGLFKPIGYALSHNGVNPFYHPRQIKELKAKLGITLDNTNGLLNETQFGKAFGSSRIGNYRKKGLIKSIGYAMSKTKVSRYYHPRQIKELKAKLGITLDNTNGLLSESQFGKAFGSSRIGVYRKKGIIVPFGYALSKTGTSPFYHPRQIKELKAKLGINLDNTTGLLNETQFGKAFGYSRHGKYRKLGLIKPVGYSIIQGGGVSPMYHPRQIKELKAKLEKIAANKSK